MQRIVLDTNIYISAVLTHGNPRTILDLVREKKLELFISEDILIEIERILIAKIKFDYSEVNDILESVRDISFIVYPTVKISEIEKDKSDNRILECGVEAKVDYIITGDNHLLSLKEYNGITIFSPRDFLYARGD
jgi:putative PIN family toxin of toxin-antitoxin system